MPRMPRFIPPGSLVELSSRTLGGRLFLRPSPEVNDLIRGILARYAERHGIGLVAPAFLLNHFHLLAVAPDAHSLSAFMRDVKSSLARRIGTRVGWNCTFWGRRYDPILVSDEEAAQVERLTYLLSQTLKENLVTRVADYPGVHAAHHLLSGKPLGGHWHNGTHAYRAGRSRRRRPPQAFLERHEVDLVPLPCWAHLPPEAYRARIAEIVARLERETRERHREEDTRPLGRRRILVQDPLRTTPDPRSGPKPRVHAACQAVRKQMLAALRAFLDAYRRASAAWREGDFTVEFPEGAFAPAPAFAHACRAGPS